MRRSCSRAALRRRSVGALRPPSRGRRRQRAVGASRRSLERRRRREPVAYIVGEREFWSLPIRVTPAVLVPRPETELLSRPSCGLGGRPGESPRSATLEPAAAAWRWRCARELPQRAHGLATDVSPAALAVARGNARAHGVARSHRLCLRGDLWAKVSAPIVDFDVVVSNPPYLAAGDAASRRACAGSPPALSTAAATGSTSFDGCCDRPRHGCVTAARCVMEMGFGQDDGGAPPGGGGGSRRCSVRADYAGIPRVLGCARRASRSGMDKIVVRGGRRLHGEVQVAGAKNAALPILFATLLTPERLHPAQPAERRRRAHDAAPARRISAPRSKRCDGRRSHHRGAASARREAPYELVKTMRASFLVLGPLLARFGRARVSLPGGCAIGGRPVEPAPRTACASMGADGRHRARLRRGERRSAARRAHPPRVCRRSAPRST